MEVITQDRLDQWLRHLGIPVLQECPEYVSKKREQLREVIEDYERYKGYKS